MGQCNSSLPAVECCNDPSRHKPAAADETRPSVTSTGTTNPSSHSMLGQNVVVESTSGSTSSNNAIQFSVALDQESEHSVCIRVELPDGKSLLLTTSLHGSSHHTMKTTNKCRVQKNQTVGVGSSKEPNKNHYKDIHFHAKPTPRDLATPPYVYFPPNYRRDTPRPPQWSHRPYVVSQGIESPPSAFRRHPNVEQNTPCPQSSDGALQSGKIHTSMVSADGLVEKQSDLMKKNSCHSQETENSWGDISVQKCIKCMPPPMTGKHDGKATFPPLDISMNDISGNTLPTRVDYDEGKDEVSITDDDEELDHQWEYHRNVRSLTMDNCMAVGPPSGQTRSESSSSPVPHIVFSPTASFTSNLSSLPRAKSYLCRHRHSNLFFSDTDVKNHSSRTCQSDSCMVMEHRSKSKNLSTTSTRQPWNPQSFPAF